MQLYYYTIHFKTENKINREQMWCFMLQYKIIEFTIKYQLIYHT